MYDFERDGRAPPDAPKPVNEEAKLIAATFASDAGRNLIKLWKRGLVARSTYNSDPQSAAYMAGWADAVRFIIKFAQAENADE